MPKRSELRIEMSCIPKTWYGRFFAAIGAALLLGLAIMFFTAFLVVAGLVVAAVIARLFFTFHKSAKGQSSRFIEAEYSVEKSDQTEHQNTGHKIEVNSKQR